MLQLEREEAKKKELQERKELLEKSPVASLLAGNILTVSLPSLKNEVERVFVEEVSAEARFDKFHVARLRIEAGYGRLPEVELDGKWEWM